MTWVLVIFVKTGINLIKIPQSGNIFCVNVLSEVKKQLRMYEHYSGIVLAGGASKRFGGQVKSKIIFGGETIISRMLATISGVFNEIIIITNTPGEYAEFGVRIASDHFRDIGPLGGIHAAMKSASADNLFVFASDMPLISKEAVIRQIDTFEKNSYDILVARTGDLIEPLHAIYRRELLPVLEDYISSNENRSLLKFFKSVNTGYIDFGRMEESKDIFFNVNSPADLKHIRNISDEKKRK